MSEFLNIFLIPRKRIIESNSMNLKVLDDFAEKLYRLTPLPQCECLVDLTSRSDKGIETIHMHLVHLKVLIHDNHM